MSNPVFHPEALQDMLEAAGYYNEKAAGLGNDFLQETQVAVEAICEAPTRWPKRKDGTRRFLPQRFPYIVVYKYYQDTDTVWIASIAHSRRKAGFWRDRLSEHND